MPGREPPEDVIVAAQAADKKWHIPASVQIAQWALESGWGAHMPAGSNNPFGIKARPGDPSVGANTTEVEGGNVVSIHAGFRKFASLADAFDYHARLLATAPVYAAARAFLPNLTVFCNALARHYATDPDYGAKLMSVIHGSDLEQYDA